MKIIAFIRATAFIMSVFAKVIALPFAVAGKLLGMCWRFIRSCTHSCHSLLVKTKAKRSQKKAENKALKIKRREKRNLQRILREQQKRHRDKERKRKLLRTRANEKAFFKVKQNDAAVVKILKKSCRIAYRAAHYVWDRVYWRSRSLGQKIYWKCHSIFQKLYWKLNSIYSKLYWKFRGLCQKIYWKAFTIRQKLYWILRGAFQKSYWKTRTFLQKFYWLYYKKSRELYQIITKNVYIDLFFVFLRSYFHKRNERDENLQCLKILGLKAYISKFEKAAKYEVIEEGRTRPVCIPEFFERNKERIEQFLSPDIYVAEITNACIIGGSNAVIARNALLNDTAYFDKEKRIDIRYSVIRTVINDVAIINDSGKIEKIEKGINLVGAASFNYYHLVVEILSRLTFVDMEPEYRSYPILVDEVVLKIPQFRAALNCVNKYSHTIVEIKKDKKYQIGSLVIPSSNVWMPTNVYDRNTIRVEDFLISKSVLNNIREAVGVAYTKSPERRIFISRKNTQAVRLRNEEAVRKIFEENSFEIVFTEEMTFRQQVECFGQAKCVVAASGAALTNIIFCQPGTVIGCIIPSEHRFYMYSTIAYLLQLKPIFLDGKIIEKTPYAAADSFEADEDYVKRYIERISVEI